MVNPFAVSPCFSFKPCVICRVKMLVVRCLFMALPGDFLNYLWKCLKATAKLDAKSTLIMALPPAATSESEQSENSKKDQRLPRDMAKTRDQEAPEKYKYSSVSRLECVTKKNAISFVHKLFLESCNATLLMFP